MTDTPDLDRFRTFLVRHMDMQGSTPPPPPLAISPWAAMSLLQKAIRRGRMEIALQAAATLLHNAPDRLWRRLGGIAFEDVGLGSVRALGITAVVLGGQRSRAALGHEWYVASAVVQALCSAPKSRASDDLYMALETLPRLHRKRKDLATLANPQLRLTALETDCLHTRALALLYLLGTNRPGGHLPTRAGEPGLAFDLLDELGVAPMIVAVSREGYRRTGELLPPLVAMLALSDGLREGQFDDPLPIETLVQGVPCWAFDMFTREGKSALARLLATNAGVAELARATMTQARRVNFLGQLLFRVEGGALQRRLRGSLADRLHTQFMYETLGLKPSHAEEALDLMRQALPLLNQLRAEIVGGGSHAQ